LNLKPSDFNKKSNLIRSPLDFSCLVVDFQQKSPRFNFASTWNFLIQVHLGVPVQA
jgi:hypothetical protein